jgi:hypothetical protein
MSNLSRLAWSAGKRIMAALRLPDDIPGAGPGFRLLPFTAAVSSGASGGPLQDLDSRREAHLTSIMRRYRDITSQFRAMSGTLDSSRDPNSSALSAAALTRIQNATSAADEDLRQLSELNAQARQLEKKLVKK